jgi:hypothetical protein
MEVANPQRMGIDVLLVNPASLRSRDNPSGPLLAAQFTPNHSHNSRHRNCLANLNSCLWLYQACLSLPDSFIAASTISAPASTTFCEGCPSHTNLIPMLSHSGVETPAEHGMIQT